MSSTYTMLAAFAVAAAASAAVAAPGSASGSASNARSQYRYPTTLQVDNKPVAAREQVASAHAPFAAGDCSFCHESADPQKPGPVVKQGNALCYDCHQEFDAIMQRSYKHPPAVERCTTCHNPHDSTEKKLLHVELASGCMQCHKDIRTISENAKVKHGALTTGHRCANCHNPHGTNVEKLLIALPYDQCVNCHGADGVTDGKGVALTNFKRLLEENKVHHAPVEAKDCSACHRTHGSDHFRLLVAEYPASFYAPFDQKNYALCLGCHNEKVVTVPETDKLTNFRNGTKNLHFVHVNKQERGRTCRACHEVHASKHDLHIRDGVPYGARGWVLKINHTRTATGGECAKTCHETKSYSRTIPRAANP